jgi:hypothetical protein
LKDEEKDEKPATSDQSHGPEQETNAGLRLNYGGYCCASSATAMSAKPLVLPSFQLYIGQLYTGQPFTDQPFTRGSRQDVSTKKSTGTWPSGTEGQRPKALQIRLRIP